MNLMIIMSSIGYSDTGQKFNLSDEELAETFQYIMISREKQLKETIVGLIECLSDIVESVDGESHVPAIEKAIKILHWAKTQDTGGKQ